MSTKTYNDIYTKLQKVIPNLEEHLEAGTAFGKSESRPFMDLHFDYLGSEGKGVHKIALAHYFEQNGDMVPDPDMEVRIFVDLKAAEAMTFQNQWTYDQIYEEHEGKTYMRPKLKKDLNVFLNQWLTNCIQQGHRIDLSETKSKEEDISNKFSEQRELEELRKRNPESPEQSLTR